MTAPTPLSAAAVALLRSLEADRPVVVPSHVDGALPPPHRELLHAGLVSLTLDGRTAQLQLTELGAARPERL